MTVECTDCGEVFYNHSEFVQHAGRDECPGIQAKGQERDKKMNKESRLEDLKEFTKAAMEGILASRANPKVKELPEPEELAKMSVDYAEALLEEIERRQNANNKT